MKSFETCLLRNFSAIHNPSKLVILLEAYMQASTHKFCKCVIFLLHFLAPKFTIDYAHYVHISFQENALQSTSDEGTRSYVWLGG